MLKFSNFTQTDSMKRDKQKQNSNISKSRPYIQDQVGTNWLRVESHRQDGEVKNNTLLVLIL